MQSILIEASSPVLAGRAQEALNKIRFIENQFGKIKSTVNKSGSYWQGDAGDAHRSVYSQYAESVESLLVNLRETADVLEQIAQNYVDNENMVNNEAAGLPGEIIV